jgi:Tol biopolymer transport system component
MKRLRKVAIAMWLIGVLVPLAACSPTVRLPPGRLVYEEGERSSRIVVMELPTKRTHYLTPGSSTALAPKWSPDGNRVAFYTVEDTHPSIWVVQAVTGDLRKIGTGSTPTWTSDGKGILCIRSDGLWRLDSTNGAEEQLTHDDAVIGEAVSSPDGQLIAYRVDTRQWGSRVKFLNMSTQASVTATTTIDCITPLQWAANSKQVSCLGWVEGNDTRVINRIDTTGNYIQQPFSYPNLPETNSADWSSDGKYLVYSTCRSLVKFSTCDLWLLELASGKTYQLTKDDVFQGAPNWSPTDIRIP